MAQVPSVAAIIVAAGRGERAGQSSEGPKQYRLIGGEMVLTHTLRAFVGHPQIARIVVAIHRDDDALFTNAAAPLKHMITDGSIESVYGGASRQQSVLNALNALSGADAPDLVLIHDGARPFADRDLISCVIAEAASGGAIPAVTVSDTLKKADANWLIEETVSRDQLYAAQTPQGFPFAAIHAAHLGAEAQGLAAHFTDDAAIAEWSGMAARIVTGSPDNIKLTWARDILIADQRLRTMSSQFPDIRVGNGYDVHATTEGDHVYLCGVRIDHDRALTGHSDADVGLHALTDALLATCGLGDIGTHFPPSDLQWKGAASHIFLEHAAKLVQERGGRIANVDVTLIAETPKIGPHRTRMTDALGAMLGLAPERISVKATTNELLGFIGRGEGIAAIATASVVFPGTLPEPLSNSLAGEPNEPT